MTLRLGVIGLDNSHPFVDTRYLSDIFGALDVRVVDAFQERVAAFTEAYPHAIESQSLEDLLDCDALLVTLRPSQLVRHIGQLAASGIPTFINKPGVTTTQHLRTLEESVALFPRHALMSASVLRFATATRRTELEWSEGIVVNAAHSIVHWQLPGNEWQADPDEGMGIVGAIGYHAFELLDEMVVGGLEQCDVSAVRLQTTPGGAQQVVSIEVAGPGGRATLQLASLTQGERYEVFTAGDPAPRLLLRGEDGRDCLGYHNAMRAFAAHISGDRRRRVDSVLAAVRLACVAGEQWRDASRALGPDLDSSRTAVGATDLGALNPVVTTEGSR